MADDKSFGPEAEKAFIDGVRLSARRKALGLSYESFLEQYIRVHKASIREIHLVGVPYARQKLERLRKR